jgi:hypothetical protein
MRHTSVFQKLKVHVNKIDTTLIAKMKKLIISF